MRYISILALSLVIMILSSACSKDDELDPASKPELSDKAEILKWEFGGYDLNENFITYGKATISEVTPSESNITFTLPYDVSTRGLGVRTEISKGATFVENPSGITDYTRPRTFVVVSESKKVKKWYRVKVNLGKSNRAELSIVEFGGKRATFNPKNNTFTLKLGYFESRNLDKTIKLRHSDKATIYPAFSHNLGDYKDPKKFTITAEDGVTKKDYWVHVIIGPRPTAPKEYHGIWNVQFYQWFKGVSGSYSHLYEKKYGYDSRLDFYTWEDITVKGKIKIEIKAHKVIYSYNISFKGANKTVPINKDSVEKEILEVKGSVIKLKDGGHIRVDPIYACTRDGWHPLRYMDIHVGILKSKYKTVRYTAKQIGEDIDCSNLKP